MNYLYAILYLSILHRTLGFSSVVFTTTNRPPNENLYIEDTNKLLKRNVVLLPVYQNQYINNEPVNMHTSHLVYPESRNQKVFVHNNNAQIESSTKASIPYTIKTNNGYQNQNTQTVRPQYPIAEYNLENTGPYQFKNDVQKPNTESLDPYQQHPQQGSQVYTLYVPPASYAQQASQNVQQINPYYLQNQQFNTYQPSENIYAANQGFSGYQPKYQTVSPVLYHKYDTTTAQPSFQALTQKYPQGQNHNQNHVTNPFQTSPVFNNQPVSFAQQFNSGQTRSGDFVYENGKFIYQPKPASGGIQNKPNPMSRYVVNTNRPTTYSPIVARPAGKLTAPPRYELPKSKPVYSNHKEEQEVEEEEEEEEKEQTNKDEENEEHEDSRNEDDNEHKEEENGHYSNDFRPSTYFPFTHDSYNKYDKPNFKYSGRYRDCDKHEGYSGKYRPYVNEDDEYESESNHYKNTQHYNPKNNAKREKQNPKVKSTVFQEPTVYGVQNTQYYVTKPKFSNVEGLYSTNVPVQAEHKQKHFETKWVIKTVKS